MTELDSNTEKLIFRAARKIFTMKGYDGARMQEIANEAGINKALLHYYFRSKDKLFEGVFRDVFRTFFPGIKSILVTDRPIDEKIKLLVNQYLDILSGNPDVAGFIFHELRMNPQRLAGNIRDIVIDAREIRQMIQTEVEKGAIRPVRMEHLIANLISMTVFPFISKPVLMSLTGMDEPQFAQFIEERRKIIPEIIIQSIKPTA